ncbi:hypothetical protein P2318_10540 [Myxococcaceae bacterium GXIMD 01537]
MKRASIWSLAGALLSTGAWAAESAKCAAAVDSVHQQVSVGRTQAAALIQYATSRKVGFVMRPLDEIAMAKRAAGFQPKTPDIKYKTCSRLDEYLGAPANCLGTLVLFKPAMPDRSKFFNPTWKQLEARFTWRRAEWEENQRAARPKQLRPFNAADKAAGAKYYVDGDPKQFRGGYIKSYANDRGFTGDLDLFDVVGPDGNALSTEPEEVLKEMIADPGVDVLHGAHMYWEVPEKHRHIYEEIVKRHRARTDGGGGAPLVLLSPECDVCTVFAPPENAPRRYTCSLPSTADAGTPGAVEETPAPAEETSAPAEETPAPAKEKVEYVHAKHGGKCEKMQILERQSQNIMVKPPDSDWTLIWDDQWKDQRCGPDALKPWRP